MKNRITKDMVYKRVEEYQGLVASDPYRLHYHIMPPVGLLNDPNGFVFFKGAYHIFYQWNPFAVEHGVKCWGHYMSEDLIHWREAPVALLPDKWYDKNGCYSGSAVVYQDQLYVFYTGNVKDDKDNRQSYQCLAVSEDGIHFEKKGPIIHVPDGYTAHFRDPKVFYRGDSWWMVLGAQTEAKKGETVVYQSKNLTTWTFEGTLIGSGYRGLENFGYMWECPDMFRLRDKDILLVCPQGIPAQGISYQNIFQSGYFAGEFDNQSMSFHHEKFIELDRGFDFYAPQTMRDAKGRRLLFGWMGNAEGGPTQHPTAKYKWVHALTVPRQLEWKNGKLLQYPVEEFKQLLENEVDFGEIHLDGDLPFPLPNIDETAFAMYLSVESSGADYLEMQIGESHLIYNQAIDMFTFKRRSFTKPHSVESRHCTVDFLHDILILKDTSSMEIFLNQGEEVFTSRIFEEQETNKIRLQANGKIKVNVKKWNVRRVTEY